MLNLYFYFFTTVVFMWFSISSTLNFLNMYTVMAVFTPAHIKKYVLH